MTKLERYLIEDNIRLFTHNLLGLHKTLIEGAGIAPAVYANLAVSDWNRIERLLDSLEGDAE